MPTRQKSFSYFLDPEEKVTLRSNFTIKSGKIEKFAVQLEFEGRSVLRFDNAHGYVHQHTFSLEGEGQVRKLKFGDNSQAYNYCYQFIKSNWDALVERFKRAYE